MSSEDTEKIREINAMIVKISKMTKNAYIKALCEK